MAETNVLNSQVDSELNRYLSNLPCSVNKFLPSIHVTCPPVFSNKLKITPKNPPTISSSFTSETYGSANFGPNVNLGQRNSDRNIGGTYTFEIPQQGHLQRAVLKLSLNLQALAAQVDLNGNVDSLTSFTSTVLTNRFGAYAALESAQLLCNNKVIETVYGRELFADMMSSCTGDEIDANLQLAQWRDATSGCKQPVLVQTHNSDNTISGPLNVPLYCYLNIQFSCFKALSSNYDSRVLNDLKIVVNLRNTYCSFRTGISEPYWSIAPDNYTSWLLYSINTSTTRDRLFGDSTFYTGSNLVKMTNNSTTSQIYLRTWRGNSLYENKTILPSSPSDTRTAYYSTNSSTVTNFRPELILYFNMYTAHTESTIFEATFNNGSCEVLSTSTFQEAPTELDFKKTTIKVGGYNTKMDNVDFTGTPLCSQFVKCESVFSNSASVELNCPNLAESILTMCDTDDFPLHFMATISECSLQSQNLEIYSSQSPLENMIDCSNRLSFDKRYTNNFLPGMNHLVNKQLSTMIEINYSVPLSVDAGNILATNGSYGYQGYNKCSQNYAHIFFNKSQLANSTGGTLGLKTLQSPRLNVNIISNEYGSHLTNDYSVFTYVKYKQLLQISKNTGNVAVLACT